MKIIDSKIAILTFILFSFNTVKADTIKIMAKQETEINKPEEAQSYYKKGMSLYKMADYFSAEKAFQKTINLVNKTTERETLAYSFYFLGNIESWKSNFSQSIHYHKNARNLFKELNNLDYVAISNNNISTGFYALAEFDSTIVYYKKNIDNKSTGNLENINRNPVFFKKKNINQTTGQFERTILEAYQGLAVLYAKLYNYKEAYSYLQQGIMYACKLTSLRTTLI